MDALRICQLNCMGSRGVMADLGKYMCDEKIGVALIQEPYCVYGRVCGLPSGFKLFQCAQRDDGYMGCVIAINDSELEVMHVEGLTNEFGVCCQIRDRTFSMYLVSVYCKYSDDMEPYISYMESVRNGCGSECLVIGMDANAVSPLWFSKGVDRGRTNDMRRFLLEDWILAEDMHVLNEPSEWFTFCGPRGVSDIDLTVANKACDRLEFVWKIVPDACISDHNVIRIDVKDSSDSSNVNEQRSMRNRWIVKDVNWIEYVDCLKDKVCQLSEYEELSVDDKVQYMVRWVTETNDECMRRHKRSNIRRIKWWTTELERMKVQIRRSRYAFQNARRTGVNIESMHAEYKERLRRYKSEIKLAKLNHWQNFVNDCGNNDVWGPVYRICNGKKRVTEFPGLKVGDRVTIDWEDSANVLLNEFFPASENDVDRLDTHGRANNPPAFEWDEIHEAVFETRVRKAPGRDGINGDMMRRIWSVIPEYISSLFNQCLNEVYFPSEWKVGDVVVLLKSPDKIRTDPHSYRPICLLPVMSKVLERMMVKRLKVNMMNEAVANSQYGFTNGKSAEDALVRVGELVKESVSKYVLGVFVDFKGAFDNLRWDRVIDKLIQIECKEVGLWRSYFCNRRACIEGVHKTVWKNVEKGCPQGSVAGPAVWNMVMNDLLIELERNGCKLVAYADDLLILAEGESRLVVERMAENYMRYVVAWGENAGVSVSEQKTECMLLKGRLAGGRPPVVRVSGRVIKYSVTARYLGLLIGERLSYVPHLVRLKEKMIGVMSKWRRVLRKDWGLRRGAATVWYKCVIVRCMVYGSPLWAECLRYQYARKKLNSCQRVILYGSLRVCRTVSTEAMQVLMGELPWDLEAIRHMVLYRHKKGLPLGDMVHVTNEDLIDCNLNEAKVVIEERMYDVWQRRWSESTNGRLTHEFIPNVSFVREHRDFECGLMLGYLLTGHGSMNGYLYPRRLSSEAACLCGAPAETVWHLIAECQLYQDLRELDGCGIIVRTDGSVDVTGALGTKETYERLRRFATDVFERRKELVNAE